jgi:DNA glycosylase AlkZ-like
VTDLAARRLHAQRLTGQRSASSVETVRWLGAVQSQDFPAAKWALAQRSRATTEAKIDRLYDDGAILRTHVMRPTWHFVLPEDIRWLIGLTSSRLRDGLAGRRRQLEIDDRLIVRANAAFEKALSGGRTLTRPELDGVLVSGPRRGKQHTWALLEERVANAPSMDRPEALAELTKRYFRSHGPAQVGDFVWWSGLTTADARLGLELVGTALEREVVEGKPYWFDPEVGAPRRVAPRSRAVAHLLPNFDEYTVGYRDRAAALHPDRPFDPTLFSFGSILANVVVTGGLVRGTWRRLVGRDTVRVEVRLLDKLSAAERAAVDEAGRRLGRFLERPLELAWA